ncbi:MAG: hypothetical protein WC413_03830 [Candidatus Nanoarchaeia archaeon]
MVIHKEIIIELERVLKRKYPALKKLDIENDPFGGLFGIYPGLTGTQYEGEINLSPKLSLYDLLTNTAHELLHTEQKHKENDLKIYYRYTDEIGAKLLENNRMLQILRYIRKEAPELYEKINRSFGSFKKDSTLSQKIGIILKSRSWMTSRPCINDHLKNYGKIGEQGLLPDGKNKLSDFIIFKIKE